MSVGMRQRASERGSGRFKVPRFYRGKIEVKRKTRNGAMWAQATDQSMRISIDPHVSWRVRRPRLTAGVLRVGLRGRQ